MDTLLVPRRDIDFMLFELLQLERLCERDRFAEHSRETFGAALDSAYDIAAEKFAPHNRLADENEPHLVDGKVVLIPQVATALKAFSDAGFLAAAHDEALGGMQMPFSVAMACWAVFKAANIPTEVYATLTIGAADLLTACAAPEQIARYVRPMLAGRWFGTMVLTEPQAGSSLADVASTATPQPDGRYLIRGQKIFITAGDHEITENIIHLVLARLPDAPPGVRGLSLFIVPKRVIRADGSVGGDNDVALAGLIHKMGYRGTTSAMLSFGEQGRCFGELVGQPNQGLACMFHMMNEARIGTGFGAAMLGYAGYVHALAYARERVQGRNAAGKQAAIIEHADVRRMLLSQKAAVEGGLALCLWAASLTDEQRTGESDEARRNAAALLDLVTPIVKSWPSKFCLEANSEAIQVHGGYGYTRDYPVEQLYRDNRLNAIHEGTYGIQSLDLLARKVIGDGGRALALLGREVAATTQAARTEDVAALVALADALDAAWQALAETSRTLADAMSTQPELALANSAVYLDAFGHTLVAWLWLRQSQVATRALHASPEDPFYLGKNAAARYFYGWVLPTTGPMHALLRRLDGAAAEMQDPWF